MSKHQERHRHHRHPKSRAVSYSGNINEERNISLVRPTDHARYHALFANMLPPEIARMLTETWISPDYYLVAIKRKRKKPCKRRKRKYCTDCEAEVLKHIPKTNRSE